MKQYGTFFLTKSLVTGLLLLLYAVTLSAAPRVNSQQQLQAFISTMTKKYQFKRQQLEKLFSQITIRPPITAVARSTRPMTWTIYRSRFLTAKRITAGVTFWQQNAQALAKAQRQYGVPANIIVAILGAETNYGKSMGSYPVLDTLANYAFTGNRRSQFFRTELTQFLLLCRRENFKPLEIKGSYAGAIGQPQFMPSSYRYYAIDFDHDRRADLIHNAADSIGSIANYFHKNGWRRGQAIATPVDISHATQLPQTSFKPNYTQKELKKFNLKLQQQPPNKGKSRFIELQTSQGKQYWLGFQNFYVITRYNHSTFYAMMVYQLGKAIKKQHQQRVHKPHQANQLQHPATTRSRSKNTRVQNSKSAKNK